MKKTVLFQKEKQLIIIPKKNIIMIIGTRHVILSYQIINTFS